ncbi:MAG: UDP-N-acetylglucosamine--N-acetylmuramyl-(pentapeptide) pyrophosphoryl-undecaprenol N-acetylglucosamine transferase, partial [Chlamydiales bacterium]
MRRKRVILSAGGTGGHLFPAQALAQTLSEECDILFVAGGLATSPYFNTAHYPFEEIACGTFSFSNPLEVMRKGGKIIKGMGQGFSILRRFSPDVIVGFGSFYTLPVLLAALIRKVPIVLHEQNAIPGKVNRLFSRFAHTTAITFPESAYYLKGNKVEVTFPLSKRKEVSAWDYFALTPGKPTLLIFGGSQGAYQLNALFLESVDKIVFPVQILHFTGKHGSVDEAKKRYKTLGIPH